MYVERGWTLKKCADQSGESVSLDALPGRGWPVTLHFEADDEAEREMQAEIPDGYNFSI